MPHPLSSPFYLFLSKYSFFTFLSTALHYIFCDDAVFCASTNTWQGVSIQKRLHPLFTTTLHLYCIHHSSIFWSLLLSTWNNLELHWCFIYGDDWMHQHGCQYNSIIGDVCLSNPGALHVFYIWVTYHYLIGDGHCPETLLLKTLPRSGALQQGKKNQGNTTTTP